MAKRSKRGSRELAHRDRTIVQGRLVSPEQAGPFVRHIFVDPEGDIDQDGLRFFRTIADAIKSLDDAPPVPHVVHLTGTAFESLDFKHPPQIPALLIRGATRLP